MIDLTGVESVSGKGFEFLPFWEEDDDGNKICKILITNSSITSFQSCKWKYRARQFWQIRPKAKSMALKLGSAFHNAIEFYYNSVPDGSLDDKALIDTMSSIDQDIGLLEDGKDALIKAMVKAFLLWSHSKSKFKTIAQEEEFLVKMPDAPDFEHDGVIYEFWLSGKIDAFLRNVDGTFWLGEWKSCTNFEDFHNHIKVSNQPWQYCLLYYLKNGSFPDGIVYRLAKKSSIRIKKTETVDDFRERYIEVYDSDWKAMIQEEVVHFNPARIDMHIDLLNEVSIDVKHAIINNTWSRNRNSCFDYNSPCPYMSLCGCTDRSSFDVIFSQGYEVHRANEELSGQ